MNDPIEGKKAKKWRSAVKRCAKEEVTTLLGRTYWLG
jgi:hypothetical protein